MAIALTTVALIDCRTATPRPEGAAPAAPGPAQAATATPGAVPVAGTVKLAGYELPYVTEGAGRPCLNYGLRQYHSRTFSPRFKSMLRCTIVDSRAAVPGAPFSATARYDLNAAAQEIEAARRALGLDRFVLVGHSVFGSVVLRYAQRYPQHVSGVISIGSMAEWSPTMEQLNLDLWNREASVERKEIHARNQAKLTPEALAKLSPSDAFVATIVASAAMRWNDPTFDEGPLLAGVQYNVPVLLQLFDPFLLFEDSTSLIEAPVFLAIGRLDFPALWEPYRARFKDLTFPAFDRSGHVPMLEEAELFDAQVAQWLQKR